ncbi:hypothetical protein MKX01_042686 [Papaver californicum]|nr:hypothetical protein MKX01_042686 [Papaver californicum]
MGLVKFNFLSLIVFTVSVRVAAQSTYIYHYCQGGNYTDNSSFQRNLNQTLGYLSSSITPNQTFYNRSTGQNQDRVYGMLLCRGDLTDEGCKSCADTSTVEATSQYCSNGKQYTAWYDGCMLRYSSKSIFSIMEVEPAISLLNTNNVRDPESFNLLVTELMNTLVSRASSNGDNSSTIKFATGNFNATTVGYQSLYGLVQCTPDISGSGCNRCLSGAVDNLPSCCFGKPGGRILRPSCNIRYEVYPFYESTATAVTAPSPSPSLLPPLPNSTTSDWTGGKSNQTIIIVVVVVSIAAFIIVSVIAICFCKRKRRMQQKLGCK